MWTFILTRKDLTPLGELTNAYEREVKLGLSRADTAACKLRVDHELVPYLFNERTMLKVFQDDVLRFWGDVLSADFQSTEDGSPPLVAVNAISPWWRASRRLVGIPLEGEIFHEKDEVPNTAPAIVGKVFTSKTKSRIVAEMLEETNATGGAVGETGIKLATLSSYTAGAVGNYTSGPAKKITDAWNELANGFDGFEWRLEPLDNVGGKIAEFVAMDNAGSVQLDVAFEAGVGQRNVRALTYLSDITNLTNDACIMPENMEELTPTPEELEAEVGTPFRYNGKRLYDLGAQATHGVMQELVEQSGIIDPALQTSLLREVLEVKKNARLVAGMTLDFVDTAHPGRVPVYGTDFNLGDIVNARAQPYGVHLFDGRVRVYAVEVKLDNNGQEAVTPILLNEGEGE